MDSSRHSSAERSRGRSVRMLAIALAVATSACTITPAGIGPSPTPTSSRAASTLSTPAGADAETANEVIDGSNSARTRLGQPLLAANELINRAAMSYARELAQRHTINHTSPT